MEIVTGIRISQACLLFRATPKPVNEICFECGFGNISFFNNRFKAITGFTPLHYRKQFSRKN